MRNAIIALVTAVLVAAAGIGDDSVLEEVAVATALADVNFQIPGEKHTLTEEANTMRLVGPERSTIAATAND